MPDDANFDQEHWDDDLIDQQSDVLLDKLVKLQEEIRRHRDIIGRPRTLDDDRRLYNVLPEKMPADFRLPPRSEFLKGKNPHSGCLNFWRSHERCPKGRCDIHNWGPCPHTIPN